jgi:hypothetical protein
MKPFLHTFYLVRCRCGQDMARGATGSYTKEKGWFDCVSCRPRNINPTETQQKFNQKD